MELIKRYVYAVGKRLPKKQRNDIEKELESSIYDSLEDRYSKKKIYSNDEIITILNEFGPPWKVATNYQKNSSFLISPDLIQTYYLILKIVAGAVTLGLLVSFIIGLFEPELSLGDFGLQFLELLGSILIGVVTAIGFVTIIFFLIQRYVPEYKWRNAINKDEWSPNDLPPIPTEKEKMPISDNIAAIVFIIIGIILFNAYAAKLGIYYIPAPGENWVFIQLFDMNAIYTYLPFWNIFWLIGLVFHIYCLIKREWNIKTRLFDIFMNVLLIGIFSIMIKGPELIDMKSLLNNANTDVAETLNPFLAYINYSLDAVFILAIVITAISIIVKTVKMIISSVNKLAE